MIKASALADFVVEFTTKEDEGEGAAPWMIWIDGSFNQRARGIGVVLQSPEGDFIDCAICLQFPTNNKVKYEAVLTGLYLAKVAGTSSVVIHNDSQVIVGHINGDYKTKKEQIKEYLSMVKESVNKKFLARFM